MIPVTITPINPATGAPAIGIHAGNISNNAPQVPASVSALPPGSILEGFVLNRDASGNPTLRTALGDFMIQSPVFLKIGSNVTLRVDAMGRNFRSHIIQIDGKPVHFTHVPDTTTATTSGKDGDKIVQSGWLPTAGKSAFDAEAGKQLHAVLLSPNAAGTQVLLKEGAPLLIRLFQMQLPAPSPQHPASPAPTPSAPPVAAPSPQTTTSRAAPLPTTALPPAAPAVTPAAIPPSGAPPAAYAPTSPSPPLPAAIPTPQILPNGVVTLSVIGQERDGEPIVQTPFGLIKITSGITLATGTQLQASISPATAASGAALPPGALTELPVTLANLAQKWTSLSDITSLLRDPATGLLPPSIIRQLPQITLGAEGLRLDANQGGVGLMLFLSVLKRGDFKAFIGEKNIRLLEQAGQDALLKKAEGEFHMLAKLASDSGVQSAAGGNQWHAMFLPVMVGGQAEMLRWYTKKEQEKSKDGRGRIDGVTRFILEVTMSEMGELQLDGLFKQQEQSKQFELMIRSHHPLEREIQHEIQQVFQEVQRSTAITGSVNFQTTPRFPMQPLEDVLNTPPDVFA